MSWLDLSGYSKKKNYIVFFVLGSCFKKKNLVLHSLYSQFLCYKTWLGWFAFGEVCGLGHWVWCVVGLLLGVGIGFGYGQGVCVGYCEGKVGAVLCGFCG